VTTEGMKVMAKKAELWHTGKMMTGGGDL